MIRPKLKTIDRDARGRFSKGNKCSLGNPLSVKVGRLRSMLFDVVTEDDFRRIIAMMVEDALGNNVTARIAARNELLSRLLGKACEFDILERLETVERSIVQIKGGE
jgi:hypothetical protein